MDGRSLVFWWVPDGTTKYIQGLTKDRGEAPKREWVGPHLTKRNRGNNVFSYLIVRGHLPPPEVPS